MNKPPTHILLVEDNPVDVILLKAALEHAGPATFHVTAAEQLSQGLRYLAEHPFDVVLLDLGLPDSQGLSTFTQLHTQAPDLPVVVLSGLHDEGLAVEAMHAGAQDYLVKGQVEEELLIRAIRYAIERHRLQAQLRASEQHFRALIEHSADGVATLTADGTITYESPAALRMLGYLPEEMTGQSAFTFIHPDDVATSSELFQQLSRHPHQPLSSELRYQRKDGTWCWLEATGTNLLEAPAVRAIVVNYRDITARKQAEAALQQLNETLELRIAERTADLRRANTDLARAAQLKDEFLANMSHELRTPLNAILGHAEMLWEEIYGPLLPKQIKALRSIEVSGQHLLALINEILDTAKIESGELTLQLGLVDINRVCQASIHVVAEGALAKQIALSTTLDPQLATIRADERRLTQILVNLLANAIKFTPKGGAVGLAVCGDPTQQTATFTVWDTGIGIAEADLPRLFQPFTQIDSGMNRQYGGAGLGLALVQRLALAHQGSVTVTSRPGQGSRFSVILPWLAGPADVARPHILLIDKNAAQAQIVVDYLQAHHYTVSVAQSEGAALDLAQKRRPSAVLLDMQLPGSDGLELTRRIRTDAQLQATPIIALTALVLPGDRDRCLAAGADAYLARPISLHTLLAVIETHLE